jgi:ABC-type branched-subunit amino acid transport system permease subunit
MPYSRPFLIEAITALCLILAPFVLPHLDFAPGTVNQILVWGLFGIGFDILFGYTGYLSFGQSAFYGTGGFIAAYLLTQGVMSNVIVALVIGTIGAALVGVLVGVIALRRTGIYFAMITVAIAETFYFVEFSPLAPWTGGENGLPGVPTPTFELGSLSYQVGSGWSMYGFLAACYFLGIVIALRIVRSPVGAVLRAIRDNPVRARAVGHAVGLYKLTAFVIGAGYAGFAGGLLGVLQGFLPPDAFTFDTSGQLVMQTAIGGVGTLFGPLLGAAVWLFLRFSTGALGAGKRVELGARCDLRAARVLPASRHHRRHRRPLSLSCRPADAKGRAGRCRHGHDHGSGCEGPRGRSERAKNRLHGGADPQGHRPHQALRRHHRQRRHRFCRQTRRVARRHRPERRGENDVLQDADLRDSAECRPDHFRRQRHHRQDRDRSLPAWSDQELSDQPAVQPPDRS